jgi:acyl carrier protein
MLPAQVGVAALGPACSSSTDNVKEPNVSETINPSTAAADATAQDIDAKIRKVLDDHARTQIPIAELGNDDDLYQAGLTSHASVNVMLALEDSFDVEFPDDLLRKSTFESVAAIRASLTTLGVA